MPVYPIFLRRHGALDSAIKALKHHAGRETRPEDFERRQEIAEEVAMLERVKTGNLEMCVRALYEAWLRSRHTVSPDEFSLLKEYTPFVYDIVTFVINDPDLGNVFSGEYEALLLAPHPRLVRCSIPFEVPHRDIVARIYHGVESRPTLDTVTDSGSEETDVNKERSNRRPSGGGHHEH